MEKITNKEMLEQHKEQLKAQISEMEDIFTFKNPKKNLRLVIDNISGKFPDQPTPISDPTKPTRKNILGSIARVGGKLLVHHFIRKNIKSSNPLKNAVGVGVAYGTMFVLKSAKRKLDHIQRRRTMESINELM